MIPSCPSQPGQAGRAEQRAMRGMRGLKLILNSKFWIKPAALAKRSYYYRKRIQPAAVSAELSLS